MVAVTFKITGLREIQNKIEKLSSKEFFDSIMLEAAMEAQMYAKNFAPVDTGIMEGSIDYDIDEDGFMLHCSVPWAVYNEFGTLFMPAGSPDSPLNVISKSGKYAFRPFMRPAIRLVINDFPNIFNRHFKEVW